MNTPTIGLDLAKNAFQVNGVDEADRTVLRKKLRRAEVFAFFVSLPPALVGIEACGGAHHWARELRKLGHDVRLMPPMGSPTSSAAKPMPPTRRRSARRSRGRRCALSLRRAESSSPQASS